MRLMKTPRSVDLSITNGCNLRCTYCSHFTGAGDVVMFEARRGPGSPYDHLIGVNLQIDVQTQLAEPGTVAVLAFALAGMGLRRRRR